MAIKVTDKYEIEADEYQFIVQEKKVAKSGKKAGEAYTVTVGYASNITHALEIIYKRETRKWVSENKATLQSAAKAFNKIAKEIKEFGKKYDME